jgi:hypothetical protein
VPPPDDPPQETKVNKIKNTQGIRETMSIALTTCLATVYPIVTTRIKSNREVAHTSQWLTMRIRSTFTIKIIFYKNPGSLLQFHIVDRQ